MKRSSERFGLTAMLAVCLLTAGCSGGGGSGLSSGGGGVVPPVAGACCLAGQTCQELSAADCTTQGGIYQGDGSACTPNPCPLAATFNGDNDTPGMNTISMADDSSTDNTFSVRMLVTGIDDFYGATFKIRFDSTISTFVGANIANSFIVTGNPADTRFVTQRDPMDSDVLEVVATREGQIAGVPMMPTETQELIRLDFRAGMATAGSAFTYEGPTMRLVETCADGMPLPMCNVVPDAQLTFSGGTLSVTN